MTSSVTWRHPDYAQSIAHRQVYIGSLLEPSRYLASFPRYLAPKLRTERMNERMTGRRKSDYKGHLAKRSWTNTCKCCATSKQMKEKRYLVLRRHGRSCAPFAVSLLDESFDGRFDNILRLVGTVCLTRIIGCNCSHTGMVVSPEISHQYKPSK